MATVKENEEEEEEEEEELTLQPHQGGIWEGVADEAVSFYG